MSIQSASVSELLMKLEHKGLVLREKDEAIFNGEASPDSQRCRRHKEGKCCGRHEEKKHGHCGGLLHGLFGKKCHGHKHHHPEFAEGSLADLMSQCGHRLFHSGDESMFDVLTEQEANTFKYLLNKVLSA